MLRPHDTKEIFFGLNMPNTRFRTIRGSKVWEDINNETLHPTNDDFRNGTYTAGALLHTLCNRHCRPTRSARHMPCPAWVEQYLIREKDRDLATVTMWQPPAWEKCAGFRKLLDACQEDYEAAFLRAYMEYRYCDEMRRRDALVEAWNERFRDVNLFPASSFATRRDVFDRLMWSTLRFPGLIPQAWLNWVSGAPDHIHRWADTNPSRVDFIAYSDGERHVVEIDGPTHWADWNGHGYVPSEQAYHRTLVIQRSLREQGWRITTLSRLEVREAMTDTVDLMLWGTPLSVLPFIDSSCGDDPTWEQLGVPELAPSADASLLPADGIPF